MNKGSHHSEETKQRMRTSHLGNKNYWFGKHLRPETKQKLREANIGKHLSEETRRKMSSAHIGEKNYMYGKKSFFKNHSEETKRKIGESKVGKKAYNWKGENVGYNVLHKWVRRWKKKSELCGICKKKEPYDLANISGEYKMDLDDYQWLCRSCHRKFDYNKTFHKGVNQDVQWG